MLIVNKLTHQYSNTDVKALDSISFSLKQGEIVGLLGHNGAGKTTLLECLSGLQKSPRNVITVDNVNLYKYHHISYIPNDLYVYNMLTVLETFIFMGQLHSLSTKKILEIVNPLLETFSLLDKKDEYVKNLSYGMKQKVSLILGILDSPNYLLLDEPMNGYDALATKTTKEFLVHLAKDKSTGVLLSSHRLDIVEDICDRVIIINQGVLIYEGSISTLKNSNSFEEALINITKGENINGTI
ncbi:ABC transporter ATP-binding protein [Bacillus mycoides]|uniref:ABC transporter ATP-binding protein n=1 Tax=Bacillus mycoides TaxID=1405 RepID=UPI0021136235|nr:ABC transporter ATP-binding protein [Bacillus mycoides]MCQ6530728.1 ABC transporter ATP-binding protein [Bacillus mycoides]